MSLSKSIWGFDPRNVPGCSVWLDAADVTSVTFSSGSNVSSWRDKAGRMAFTATNSPVWTSNAINGVPAMYSAARATGQYFSGAINTAITGNTVTVFAVATTTLTLPNAVGDQRLVSLATTAAADTSSPSYLVGLFNGNTTSTIATARSTGGYGSNTIVINTPFLASSVYSSTLASMYFNGTLAPGSYDSGTSAFAISQVGIGNQAFPNGQIWQGYIGEVLIYSNALTIDQRQQVEGYLAWKWGLKASLPATTQYKLLPPLMQFPSPPDFGPMLFWWDSSYYSNIAVSSGTVGAGGTVSSWRDRINNVSLTVPTGFVGPLSTSNGISFTNVSATSSASSQILNYSNTASPYSMAQNATLIVASAPNRFDAFRNVFSMGAEAVTTGINPAYLLGVQVGASEGNSVGAFNGSTSVWRTLQRSASSNTAGAGRVDSILSATSNFTWTNGTENTYSLSNVGRGTLTVGVRYITGMVIGGVADFQANREYDGLVYEILVYADSLSKSSIEQIEGYLSRKWKFYLQLNTAHSFYRLPSSAIVPYGLKGIPNYLNSGAGTSYMAKYDKNGAITMTIPGGGYIPCRTAIGLGDNVCFVNNTNTASAVVYNGDGTYNKTVSTGIGGVPYVVNYNAFGQATWVAYFTMTTGSSEVRDVCSDSTGNFYVMGHYNNTLTVYSATGTLFGTLTCASAGTYYDVFIVKYNASGVVQWTTRISGTGAITGNGMFVDSAANVYAVGTYTLASANTYTTAGVLTKTLANSGSTDVFIAKYNTSGVPQWATNITGTGAENAISISADSTPNVYVYGTIPSTGANIYNADTTLFKNVTPLGGSTTNLILIKYSSAGVAQWEARMAGTGNIMTDCATTSAGVTYLIGQTSSASIPLYNAAATLVSTMTNPTTSGAVGFAIVYSTAGSPTASWFITNTVSGTVNMRSIALGSSGEPHIVGDCGALQLSIYNASGAIAYSPAIASAPGYSALRSLFLVKYTSAGAFTWMAAVSPSGQPSGSDEANNVSVNTDGNICVSGVIASSALTFYSQGKV